MAVMSFRAAGTENRTVHAVRGKARTRAAGTESRTVHAVRRKARTRAAGAESRTVHAVRSKAVSPGCFRRKAVSTWSHRTSAFPGCSSAVHVMRASAAAVSFRTVMTVCAIRMAMSVVMIMTAAFFLFAVSSFFCSSIFGFIERGIHFFSIIIHGSFSFHSFIFSVLIHLLGIFVHSSFSFHGFIYRCIFSSGSKVFIHSSYIVYILYAFIHGSPFLQAIPPASHSQSTVTSQKTYRGNHLRNRIRSSDTPLFL